MNMAMERRVVGCVLGGLLEAAKQFAVRVRERERERERVSYEIRL